MKVIQQTGSKHDDKGQAQDALAGIAAVPGFVFGYVNNENRCVTFHKVAAGGTLQRGQQEVDLVVGERLDEWPYGATVRLRWTGPGGQPGKDGWAKRDADGKLVSAYSLTPLDLSCWSVAEERSQ